MRSYKHLDAATSKTFQCSLFYSTVIPRNNDSDKNKRGMLFIMMDYQTQASFLQVGF